MKSCLSSNIAPYMIIRRGKGDIRREAIYHLVIPSPAPFALAAKCRYRPPINIKEPTRQQTDNEQSNVLTRWWASNISFDANNSNLRNIPYGIHYSLVQVKAADFDQKVARLLAFPIDSYRRVGISQTSRGYDFVGTRFSYGKPNRWLGISWRITIPLICFILHIWTCWLL